MTLSIFRASRLAALATGISLVATGAVLAQATDLTGVDRLDDRIDDIRDDVDEDLSRSDDALRYNVNGVPQGWQGSVALRAAGTDGNTETADFSLGGRLTYGVGDWSHSFGVAAEYGETDGVTDQEEVFATYEGLRAFSPRVYAFGTGRLEYDSFNTVERDAFLGAGLGYRVLADESQTWRVQAGPGVRYTELANGDSDTEAAGIVSSRYYVAITDLVSVTNDTDILTSDANTQVQNDFGVNYRLSDTLSARASYRTDYESDPLPGFQNTDSTLGVSLVVGF